MAAGRCRVRFSVQEDWRADVLEREALRIRLVSWYRALWMRWKRRPAAKHFWDDAPWSQLGGCARKRTAAIQRGGRVPWVVAAAGAALAVVSAAYLSSLRVEISQMQGDAAATAPGAWMKQRCGGDLVRRRG